MARIFNIYFHFDDHLHSAVVNVRKTAFFTEYSLINFNTELLDLLPSNKILSRADQQFSFQDANDREQTPLMKAIIEAVSQHLAEFKMGQD